MLQIRALCQWVSVSDVLPPRSPAIKTHTTSLAFFSGVNECVHDRSQSDFWMNGEKEAAPTQTDRILICRLLIRVEGGACDAASPISYLMETSSSSIPLSTLLSTVRVSDPKHPTTPLWLLADCMLCPTR